MFDVKESLRDALGKLDRANVAPAAITVGSSRSTGFSINLASCSDYERTCAAWKITPAADRWDRGLAGRDRSSLVPGDGPVLGHHCFPHLDCWKAPA